MLGGKRLSQARVQVVDLALEILVAVRTLVVLGALAGPGVKQLGARLRGLCLKLGAHLGTTLEVVGVKHFYNC